MSRFTIWLWHAPSRLGAMGTWPVLRFVIFCLALAVVLPFAESYLATWLYGSKFTQQAIALLIDKTQSLLGLLGAVRHQNLSSVWRGVPPAQLQLANGWAWLLFGSTVLPLLLAVVLLIGHHTWNSVSASLDLFRPPKDT